MAAKIPYLVIITLFLASCGSPGKKDQNNPEATGQAPTKESEELKWIEGEFELLSENGIYRVFWRKNEDNQYIGKGYFLTKGDTSFLIRMKLFNDNAVTKMIYNIREHDNGKDIEFTLSKAADDLFIFENPFRDFPSVMQYRFMGDTAIHIIERGFDNDKEKVKDFTLKRIPAIKN